MNQTATLRRDALYIWAAMGDNMASEPIPCPCTAEAFVQTAVRVLNAVGFPAYVGADGVSIVYYFDTDDPLGLRPPIGTETVPLEALKGLAHAPADPRLRNPDPCGRWP